jgi:hypothetical protein
MGDSPAQRGVSFDAAPTVDFSSETLGQNLSAVERQVQLTLYQHQIDQNQQQQAHSSYLEKLVHLIWHPENAKLKDVRDQVDQAATTMRSSQLTDSQAANLAAKFDSYQNSFDRSRSVSRLGSELVKNGFLFFGGDFGAAGAATCYALDEMHANDPVGAQVVDCALGATKGVAISQTMDALDATGVNPVFQGLGGGISSRLIDNVFSRTNYAGKGSSFDLRSGIGKSLSSAFNMQDLTTDVITLGSALALFDGANGITAGAMTSHRLPRKISVGTVYGLTMGASSELQRQHEAGEKFDFSKVAQASMALGAIDALASVPGGLARSTPAKFSLEYNSLQRKF